MLTIGALSLRLPAGFEHRAERIGRLLGDALAGIEAGSAIELDRLALPPVTVARDTGDVEVATRIADSVRHQLAAARRGGDR
ncbi:MAG TPA: hypothetical protein VF469_16125 [Kofleriaceae bacterium]